MKAADDANKKMDADEKKKKPTYTHKGGDKLKSLKVRHPEKPSDE